MRAKADVPLSRLSQVTFDTKLSDGSLAQAGMIPKIYGGNVDVSLPRCFDRIHSRSPAEDMIMNSTDGLGWRGSLEHAH
jgi:hypothetical protein